MRPAIHLAISVLAASFACSPLHAQTAPAPIAPLPASLANARKLFLGNAGDQENDDCLRAYNDLYAGLAALGSYELVSDPSAADLILEMHYEVALGQAIGTHDTNNSIRQFRVVILDPKSHFTLWSLTEKTNYAIRQVNRDKNLDETVGVLVKDLASLLASQPVPPNNKSRVVH